MKKFVNKVEDILAESLRGFGAAHPDLVKTHFSPTFVTRAGEPVKGKVALISGGGSGHEPLHTGFVGRGMLDAACPGEVFTSPTPDQMLAAAEAVDGGAGVLFIVKNYSGDVMNFEMATEMFAGENASVITNDDVAVEDSTYTTGRRGVAGTMIVEKIVGAAAEAGADLAACTALAERVNKAAGSMGVALTSCTVPAAGTPTLDIGEDEMEMGVGIHGEPGRRRVKLATADAIAEETIGAITAGLGLKSGDRVLLMVNGFGGTPLMELYLMYDTAARLCAGKGLKIARSMVGNFTTSLEMAGCSITLVALDDEMIELWDVPVHTAALRWGC
ncbi:MAG: dihydroxyacetone kinase subunit DhaK [Alphaproteobacteria bacterium]|nr:MAG: dihydroxyacetone kinase subunit DhaK [Alphaproteobacteria bacterium]